MQQYIIDVILHVVKNYNIDGVHFDDYFYPYPAGGQSIPDAQTFARYGNGFSRIEDWRRDNVNQLIKNLSDSVRREKSLLSSVSVPLESGKTKSNTQKAQRLPD